MPILFFHSLLILQGIATAIVRMMSRKFRYADKTRNIEYAKIKTFFRLLCDLGYKQNILNTLFLKKTVYVNLRVIPLLITLIIVSCNQNGLSEKETLALRNKADSIADSSQKVLLQNVAAAIQRGGTEYAVDFCHISALPITDSLAKEAGMTIQRISDKNRNPGNTLKTRTDYSVFDEFKRKPALSDTLLTEKDKYVYYKRINLGMPTCMKCHGNPTVDIEEKTLRKIARFYPNDKAVGYTLNEFRGLWKIAWTKAE